MAQSLRHSFTDFFARHGHDIRAAASLVPEDPSLLFTNAGMVQFKPYLLGEAATPRPVVTVQPCVRAGGKHNDLDNVGFTPRHQTLFEMLGNFSFGHYQEPHKEQAIVLAWEFLTRELGLPAERLSATVHHSDAESLKIWEAMGVPVTQLGDEDNAWAAGPTGPTGLCTEIFWGELELWNLVFMSHSRGEDGQLTPLPHNCVDTGAGLERLLSVLQGVDSNFETDALRPLVEAAGPLDSPAARVVADHARSAAALVAAGVMPSNHGRGYVLRRIIRRAVRHAGDDVSLAALVPLAAASLGGADAIADPAGVAAVLRAEEALFRDRLRDGLKEFDRRWSAAAGISPEDAFLLHDSFGFPVDLTAMLARERGGAVDEAAVARLMQAQRERARAAWTGSGAARDPPPVWPGPDAFSRKAPGRLVEPAARVVEAEGAWVSIEPCPFYAEGGGQVGDTGTLGAAGEVDVLDAVRTEGGRIALRVAPAGALAKGDDAGEARVDAARRQRVAAHHTATHLLNAALRELYGDGVVQAGSLVAPDRLRFDFSHAGGAVDARAVEARVTELARAGGAVTTREMPLAEARALGAVAAFGEKYGETVRVVSAGAASTELCGGTHVADVAEVLPFRVLSESSAAAGTRRIEAVAGPAGVEWLGGVADAARAAGEVLGAFGGDSLVGKAEAAVRRAAELSDSLQALLPLVSVAPAGQGRFAVALPGVPPKLQRQIVLGRAQALSREAGGAAVLVVVEGGGAAVCCGEGAPEVFQAAVAEFGGRGGGRGGMAQGSLDRF